MPDDVAHQLAHQQFGGEHEVFQPPGAESLPDVLPGLSGCPGVVRQVERGDIIGDGAPGVHDEQSGVVGRLLAVGQQARHDRVAQLLQEPGVTVLVALVSEIFVASVQKAAETFGMTPAFVGFIVVALVGGAAEMASAFSGARKNRLDLSVGIALGSASQIALFVAPVLVFSSYLFPHQLSLEFTIPEVVAVVIAAFVTDQIAGDGESNWLEGVQLLALYAILAVLFYFLPATR